MAEHIFRLLGPVNPSLTSGTVREKHIIVVTAEQLGSLLQYERKGSQKSAPFRITPNSTIRLDSKIQRGTDEAGFLQQQPSKILDIAATLLGDPNAKMLHVYLGSLVWNIRKPNTLEITELARPNNKPPEYRLRVDTDNIYLTDSAHRHFGIANNNATMKALFRIGGRIRQMQDWEAVIDRLQNDLIVPHSGKFFQRENQDLTDGSKDSPMASINADGSINVQVQTKTINRLYEYLSNKLGLNSTPLVCFTGTDGAFLTIDGSSGATWHVQRQTENIKTFEFRFVAPRTPLGYEDALRLTVDAPTWKQANFKGANKLVPTRVIEDASYQHPTYTDLARFTAFFEVKLPPAPSDARIRLTFGYPDLDRTPQKVTLDLSLVAVD